MNKKLSLIHIPKSAGSYIRHLVYKDNPNFVDTKLHGFYGQNPACHKDSDKYVKLPKNADYSKFPGIENLEFMAIIRNPFDLLFSYYSHCRMDTEKHNIKVGYSGWMACNTIHGFNTFEEFIKAYCDPDFQWHMPIMKEFLFGQIFKKNGECVPKYIIRYERLDEGLGMVGHLYKPNTFRNKAVNKSPKILSYKEAYTEEMKQLVTEKCKKELQIFNYDFDGPKDDLIMLNPLTLKYNWGA